MLKLDTKIDLDLQKFLRWWGGELAHFVPSPVIKIFGGRRPRLIISRGDNAITVSYVDDSETRILGQWPLNETARTIRDELFVENPEMGDSELRLRLSPSQSLTRVFKLPDAAAENLMQVVTFELDRLTPFKPDQVYFDVKILARLPETRQIRVELALTPRRKLDALLDELAELGWLPEKVEVESAKGGTEHDLLPTKFRPAKSRLPGILTAASGILFFLMILAVLGLPILANLNLLDQLQGSVQSVGKVAKEVQNLRETAEKLTNESDFLLQKKRQEPILVDMLEELTKLIPDQTSLNGLQYRDRKVTIQGESPAASSLIERLEASPYFKNTSFVSPVTKDVNNGQERFQISSEVVNGRFSDKAGE